MDPSVLATAVERTPLGDDGRSGAALERLVLADGRRMVVKRYDPEQDLLMRMLGDARGREVEVVLSGVLDRLPPEVRHPVLGAWFDDRGLGVVVMRDLGADVLTWSDVVPRERTELVLTALARMHGAYRDAAPDVPTPLGDVVAMFERRRLERFRGPRIVDAALRGWDHWETVAPGEVGRQVLALAEDCSPLTAACLRRPATLLHGDLATVNMAFEPDSPGSITLFDWGTATVGPAEVDVGRLLAGCGHLLAPSLPELLDLHRRAAGEAYDGEGMLLGLLAGLVWLGWNKALDVVEHPDPGVRRREREGLDWWLEQAGRALEAGVV